MNCFLTNILLATDGSEATEWAMEQLGHEGEPRHGSVTHVRRDRGGIGNNSEPRMPHSYTVCE
jgi:hypothetical protein